jgi:hypothetical protein
MAKGKRFWVLSRRGKGKIGRHRINGMKGTVSHRLGGFFRILLGLGLIIVVYTILILLGIYPYRPKGLAGWLILVGLGIPLTLFLEWIGEFVFGNRIAEKISKKPFSGGRVIYALGAVLIFLTCAYLLW